jgi:hypothetical protein
MYLIHTKEEYNPSLIPQKPISFQPMITQWVKVHHQAPIHQKNSSNMNQPQFLPSWKRSRDQADNTYVWKLRFKMGMHLD